MQGQRTRYSLDNVRWQFAAPRAENRVDLLVDGVGQDDCSCHGEV